MLSFHPAAPANGPRPSLCHVNRATLDPPLFFSPGPSRRRIIKLPRAATPVQIARNEIPSGACESLCRLAFPPGRMRLPDRRSIRQHFPQFISQQKGMGRCICSSRRRVITVIRRRIAIFSVSFDTQWKRYLLGVGFPYI